MKKHYRLWALAYSAEAMEEAYRQRFSRVGADYILIYSAKKPKLPCAEVTEDEVFRLTGAEGRWLQDCNVTLILEETKRNSGEMLKDLGRKIDALETALRQQREIEEAQSEDGRTDQSES